MEEKMKNILEAPFIVELCQMCSNMYRLGWDERNGGNISCLLEEEQLTAYLDVTKVIREIPTGFDASYLAGKYFIVTGTGKYFKNIEKIQRRVWELLESKKMVLLLNYYGAIVMGESLPVNFLLI